MTPNADSFRMPDPVFAEWSYYNIDYALLAALPLDTQCPCSAGTMQCDACEDMLLACQRELEKVGSFLHMKGSESEHTIQACEHHTQTIAQLAPDEQLIRLGQIEEAIGAGMGQVLALARFRRSNFTGLWRQLCRVREHCAEHFNELVELLAASPLFGESSLETHQLFRVSQVFASIQCCYASGVSAPQLPAFPALALWRGWVDPARVRRVLRLLRRRLASPSADMHAASAPGLVRGTLSQYGSFATVGRSGRSGRPHKCVPPPPPSPPNTYQSSSAHTSPKLSARQSSNANFNNGGSCANAGSNVCTVYLDTPALTRYHAGLLAEASTCDSFSLAWTADNTDTAVQISHDTLHGPWLADRRSASAVSLQPHQLLPFLQSELNLNKLTHSQSFPHLPLSPDSDSEHRLRQRELQRNAQKIQKQIILEGLKPLVLASEERFEFVDPLVPGFRVVLRTHISLAYHDQMAENAPGAAGQCWLQNVLYSGLDSVGGQAKTELLPFGLIEVHLGDAQEQMPDWLAHLFFESALVHPVLDFDLYLHAVATLRTQHVADLPYWMADCYRGPFGSPSRGHDSSPCSSPSTRVSALRSHRSPSHSPIDIPATLATDRPLSHVSETTHLLPSPVSVARSHRLDHAGHLRSHGLRYYLTFVLAAATVFSIAISVWPHHRQIAHIVVELIDLIAQW
ncbi:vacuolar transporter chaperone, partial [Coemansia erecta]